MALIIRETKEEISFDNDFGGLFKQMFASIPLDNRTRESFFIFYRKLRNEVVNKWKPK